MGKEGFLTSLWPLNPFFLCSNTSKHQPLHMFEVFLAIFFEEHERTHSSLDKNDGNFIIQREKNRTCRASNSLTVNATLKTHLLLNPIP